MTPTTERLLSASFPNRDRLRQFIRERYGDSPPALVFVAGIPEDEGGGVRYSYADGSEIESAHGRLTYWSDPAAEVPTGEWDPMR